MSKTPFTPPEYKNTSFNCPFCSAFSAQIWLEVKPKFTNTVDLSLSDICFCSHCRKYSIWYAKKMIYPDFSATEPSNDDLIGELKTDYDEAASILQKSPRGAAALLRLVIQKLCIQLGEKGSIDEMIGELAKKGLPSSVQKALDTVRVVGNEAVHPGQLDLKDDVETASKLFRLVNFIVEKMISEPKEIQSLFEEKVPEKKKKAIEKRDAK